MEPFHRNCKILACVALLSLNMYYANTQPGFMDAINGAVSGLVFYAIWFARERTE